MPANRPLTAKASTVSGSTPQPRRPGGLDIAADGIERAPEWRGVHPCRDDDRQHHHEEDRRGERRRGAPWASRKSCGRSEIQAPPVTVIRPPRRTDSMPSVTTIGGNARIGHQHADEGVDGDAHDDGRRPGDPDRIALGRQRAGDGGENADQGTDRHVDVARDDHHRHPDRGHRDIGVAGEDADEVVAA